MTTKTKLGSFAVMLLLLLLGGTAWWLSHRDASARCAGRCRGDPAKAPATLPNAPAPRCRAASRARRGHGRAGACARRGCRARRWRGGGPRDQLVDGRRRSERRADVHRRAWRCHRAHAATAARSSSRRPRPELHAHRDRRDRLSAVRAGVPALAGARRAREGSRGARRDVFLFPALDYHGPRRRRNRQAGRGRARAAARHGARRAGRSTSSATEWTTDKDGAFVFHAADGAVFEATVGATGAAGACSTATSRSTQQLTIKIATGAARATQTISGHVVDEERQADRRRARARDPDEQKSAGAARDRVRDDRPDGAFELNELDHDAYASSAEDEDHAPVDEGRVSRAARTT